MRFIMGSKEKKKRGEEREKEKVAVPAQKLRAFLARCHNIVIISLIALIGCNSMLLVCGSHYKCVIRATLLAYQSIFALYN